MSRKHSISCLVTVACVLFLPILGLAQGVEALTKPSRDLKLSFPRPGIVTKVLVTEGQVVKKGELLVQQDDSAEQAQLKQLTASADDATRVQAADSTLKQKKGDLTKFEDAHQHGASPDLEVEHARLDAEIAGYQLAVEKFQREQDRLKQKELECQIERMKIRSPIDGRIEEIMVREGESSDTLTKVIRVVKIDPLWVDVQMRDLARTFKLQADIEQGRHPVVEVRFGTVAGVGDARPAPAMTAKGRIIFVAGVDESASNTRKVTVEVPNPTARPAGESVEVQVVEDSAAASAADEKANKVSASK